MDDLNIQHKTTDQLRLMLLNKDSHDAAWDELMRRQKVEIENAVRKTRYELFMKERAWMFNFAKNNCGYQPML